MALKDLAENFHYNIGLIEEHRIDLFQREKRLKELRDQQQSVADRLRILHDADEIEQLKGIYDQEKVHAKEIGEELLDELKRAGIKPEERVSYHIKEESWFDVWYLDSNEVYATIGAYTRL